MWICPTCGEPHQDQFKECWKCVGAEMPAHLSETASLPPATEGPSSDRRLRPFTSILARAVVGFLVGALIAVGLSQRTGQPFPEASLNGLFWGLVSGAAVGVFGWVFFPYRTMEERQQSEPNEET